MAYVLGSVPFFDCLVRKEYLHGMASGHGEFVPAVAHAVRCVRGHSLWFQTALCEPYGGVAYLLPIEALSWLPCEAPADLTYVQPWDTFSSDFGVCELDFMRRAGVEVLPSRVKGQYRFTIDFVGSDLSEHTQQHKCLHVCFLDGGLIGAFPNNRILWHDPAFWDVATEIPRLRALAGEFRSEGHQSIMRQPMPVNAPVTTFVGEKKKAKPKKTASKKNGRKPASKKPRKAKA